MGGMPASKESVTVLVPKTGSRFGKVIAGALVVLAVVVAAGRFGIDLLPSFHSPFGTKTVDRTGPALLQSLQDVSKYDAATANFQVLVDSEKDAKFFPAVIKGERTVFAAVGSVDATVDFSALDERSLVVSADRQSVTVTLPEPVLSSPKIDNEQSKVVSRQRGLLDRIGSIFSATPTSDRQYLIAAEQKMTAAANDSDLRNRAETNTRAMLEKMLKTLGYSTVTVTFAPNPA